MRSFTIYYIMTVYALLAILGSLLLMSLPILGAIAIHWTVIFSGLLIWPLPFVLWHIITSTDNETTHKRIGTS